MQFEFVSSASELLILIRDLFDPFGRSRRYHVIKLGPSVEELRKKKNEKNQNRLREIDGYRSIIATESVKRNPGRGNSSGSSSSVCCRKIVRLTNPLSPPLTIY